MNCLPIVIALANYFPTVVAITNYFPIVLTDANYFSTVITAAKCFLTVANCFQVVITELLNLATSLPSNMNVSSCTLNNSLNNIHERALRLVYDNHGHSFKDIFEMANKKDIYHKLRIPGKENLNLFF